LVLLKARHEIPPFSKREALHSLAFYGAVKMLLLCILLFDNAG